MYNILIENIKDKYDYNELIKIFLRPDQYRLFTEDEPESPAGCDDVSIVFKNTTSAARPHQEGNLQRTQPADGTAAAVGHPYRRKAGKADRRTF